MEVEGGGGTKQSSSSADFPEELVFAILKWVPATSLLRLRCVCKRWNSVIDDDDFVAAHHEIAVTADPGFMFSHYDYDPRASPSFYSCCHNGGPHYESRDLTMNQIMEKAGGGGGHAGITASIEVSFTKLPLLQRWRTPSTFLFSTCRGLALYARESENEEVFEINFFVFNPVTGEEVELPPLLLPPAPPRPLPNEVTAQSNYVLGFDGRSGVYKVLVLDSRRISGWYGNSVNQCLVHTVGTDQCWRPVHLENPHAIWFTFYQREAALDGCLHWISDSTGKILSFDLHEEMFFNSLHAKKPAKPVKQGLWGLMVLGQSLAATRSWGRYDRANRREKPEQCFDIWVLEDETTNTWSDHPSEIIFPNTYDYVRIQGSWEDNHLMAIYDNSFLEQGMIAYNVKTGACTNFYHMPGYVRVLPHHPSLASPKKLSVLQNTKYLKFEEKSKARKWPMEPPSSPVIEEECLSFDFDLSSLFG